MSVLLSIRPEHVKRIIDGKKKYEFRRTIFRQRARLDTVYIYCTSPVRRIVASFTISKVITAHPKILWKRFKGSSGLTREIFFQYFAGRTRGVAIEIGDLRIFERPIDPKLRLSEKFIPPQSFSYLDKNSVEHLEKDRMELVRR